MHKLVLTLFLLFGCNLAISGDICYGKNYFENIPIEIQSKLLRELKISDIVKLILLSKYWPDFVQRFLSSYDKFVYIDLSNKSHISLLKYLTMNQKIKRPFLKLKIRFYWDDIDEFLNVCTKNVTRLNLRDNVLGPEIVKTIFESQDLSNLELLILGNNQIGSQGVSAITEFQALNSLHYLDLSSNKIDDYGIVMLSNYPSLLNLKTLILWGNNIHSIGIIAIFNSPYLINLISLNLGSNNIDNSGVVTVANLRRLPNLQSLNLRFNDDIGIDGFIAFLNSPYFFNLKNLELPSAEYLSIVGNEVANKLKKRYEKVSFW